MSERCGLTVWARSGLFINTKHTKFERWEPPLVDADWHAFCQAIYKGIERKEWEDKYDHCRELSQAV